MKKIKYLSLFSGIGGFELGIQQAYENNIRCTQQKFCKDSRDTKSRSRESARFLCIGYSEIDKYAIQIYKKHFKHKEYGDITKINVQELQDFDLIVGGFPCQSFSIAGKRGGFKDTRGTLFFEIARIAKAKRPRLLLLENVKGLLSHNEGNTFATIISTLDELGYDCQWQVLNSKNFGVPQNRERVFIIGHLRGTSRPKVFPIGETNKKVNRDKSISRIVARGGLQNNSGEMIEQSPALTEAMGKGGGQIPIIKQLNESNSGVFIQNPKMRDFKKRKIAGSLIASQYKEPQVVNSIRRLTPIECERLQGFPDNFTKYGINEKGEEVEISDTQRYKTLGNAVTVNVIKEIIKRLI